MGNIRTNAVLVLVALSIASLHTQQQVANGLELPAYEIDSFANPYRDSVFTRLVSDNETGNVYVGGGDKLYRLTDDFRREEMVNTAVECEDDPCPVNYNKILLVDYEGDRLITCGSENSGRCQTRELDNIMVPVVDDNTPVVAPGQLSTEAIIAPGSGTSGDRTLYVAATYEEDRYVAEVRPVTKRTLQPSPGIPEDNIFNLERGTNYVLLDRNLYPSIPFLISYVGGFIREVDDSVYTYFVTTQRQDFDQANPNDRNYVSKINRVCQAYPDNFNSYTEITLECRGTADNYNLIQAVHVGPAGADLAASMGLNTGDDVLYGVFAKNEGMDGNEPSNQSAVCVFKLEDIEEKNIDGILGCLQLAGGYQLTYVQGSDSDCIKNPLIGRDTAIAQQCSAQNWARADEFNPLVSPAVVEWTDTIPSSIITTIHRDHTVAFVGTANGELVKNHIMTKLSGREYERFTLDTSPSSPAGKVLRDTYVDETKELVTILTEQKLIKLNVSNCAQFTTCDECIGVNARDDGDPYCGWCTLEKRCSRHDDCPMADVSTRWLPYNSVQCVSISSVTPFPNQPITAPSREITLIVQQLPELADNHFYQCIFDDAESSRATPVDNNKLMCNTPVNSKIPAIPAGSDHVTMKLNVHSTETQVKFVTTDYNFYECGSHSMCVACTNSSWACDWCIYSNVCTHDNGTCTQHDDPSSIISGINNPNTGLNNGPTTCPQLAPQDGPRLVSVGVDRSISVSMMNLPENKVNTFECVLHVEGGQQTTTATRDMNNITCIAQMYTYNEEEHMLDVRLSVMWNGDRVLDDIHGFDVTLYKCEVKRPDCSQCLSSLTTMPELGCGWCQNDGICSVQDSPECSGRWISPGTNTNCPNPVLSGVWPPTGPYEGNTIITVTGSDLGQEFNDIQSVTVGGEVCDTIGLQEKYKAGSSVSCRTIQDDIDAERKISVTVMGSNGNPQESTGDVIFTYRNPSISSFMPVEGPADGGTEVVISGMYLDAGYDITARIGSPCKVERENSTYAMCRTSGGTAEETHLLVMSFDGANRNSEDRFKYSPNPMVFDVQPRTSIESGGRVIYVTGMNLRLAQDPMFIVYQDTQNFTDMCTVKNDTMMTCLTPDTRVSYTDVTDRPARRKKRAGEIPNGQRQFGFIVGDVQSLRDWSTNNNATMDFFEDPIYTKFDPEIQEYSGDILILMGENLDYASNEDDVKVYVSTEEAEVQSLDTNTLTVKIPGKNPGPGDFEGNNTDAGHPYVSVVHGNIQIAIGQLRYPEEELPIPIIIIAGVCGFLVLLLLIAGLVLRNRIKSHEEETSKLLIEMQNLETSIADDIRTAFAQLQTDVTDLTSDLEGTGMPFVSHRQYAMSMFFYGLDVLPSSFDPEHPEESLERAMVDFSKLLSNKTFLMAFIQTIDDDKKIPTKEKQNIASLLTVLMILEDKLAYLTDVMITLMSRHVQEVVEEDRPRQLFQRTETIVEKLLTNWIALCLYDFLKDHTAYPLFLLYRAIKCQSEKGPIDVVTGRAHFSLSDENVLPDDVSFQELTLQVIVNDEDGEKKEVKVLDIDTISQVKEKMLDSIYRNRPYSARQNARQVDLEWRHGQSGHLVLQDVDVSSHTSGGWKKINSLKHFSVPDCSRVALVVKQTLPNAVIADSVVTGASNYPHTSFGEKHSLLQKPYNLVDYQVEDGIQIWHLAKEHEGTAEELPSGSKKKKDKAVNIAARSKTHIKEINFPRLLGTKGTVQEYVDQMFEAILNTQDVPLGIKYIFDYFDGQARRYDVMDGDVLHKWKSNTLPLRFWQNIITHPNYIFDVRESRCVEASLRVVSQAFFDAFSKSDHKLGKNAPFNKLLYNREMPRYRELVHTYYSSVSEMEKVSKSMLEVELTAICQKFTGLFSRISTLSKLYEMTQRYKTQLEEALEEDEQCQRNHLAEKLEEISSKIDEDESGSNDFLLS